MRSLAELIGVIPVGGYMDLGDEQFTGGTVHPRIGVTIENGVLLTPLTVYDPVGFLWSKWTYRGSPVDSGACIGMLGGSDWSLIDGSGTGGRAYGQIQVGLYLSAPAGHRVPLRWTIDRCRFSDNGIALTHLYPQDHSIYVLTSPEVDMKGVIRDCEFGPSLNGTVMKIGGTGGAPATEGSRGVTVQNTKIHLHADNAGAVLLQGANTRNVIFENVTWDRPGQIRATDGARAVFTGAPSPGETFVTTHWPSERWRLRTINTKVANGRTAPGIAWLPGG